MALTRRTGLVAGLIALPLLAGCSPDFSPNTYSAAAVQQANKVEQGVVVGVRQVDVKVAGTNGAVAGGAAGSIAGSQLPGSSATQALGAVGGGLLGGFIGTGVERAAGDTKAYEYIVRKPNGDLVSVTQVDTTPMALGQRVLVIAGNQARIVPDYTTAPPETPKAPAKTGPSAPAVPQAPTHIGGDALTPAPVDTPAATTPTPAPVATPVPAAATATVDTPAAPASTDSSPKPAPAAAPTPLAPPAAETPTTTTTTPAATPETPPSTTP